MKKVALLTGITGQDGSYFAEVLLEKGYEVHGVVRRASTGNRDRVDHLLPYEHGKKRNCISIMVTSQTCCRSSPSSTR